MSKLNPNFLQDMTFINGLSRNLDPAEAEKFSEHLRTGGEIYNYTSEKEVIKVVDSYLIAQNKMLNELSKK